MRLDHRRSLDGCAVQVSWLLPGRNRPPGPAPLVSELGPDRSAGPWTAGDRYQDRTVTRGLSGTDRLRGQAALGWLAPLTRRGAVRTPDDRACAA